MAEGRIPGSHCCMAAQCDGNAPCNDATMGELQVDRRSCLDKHVSLIDLRLAGTDVTLGIKICALSGSTFSYSRHREPQIRSLERLSRSAPPREDHISTSLLAAQPGRIWKYMYVETSLWPHGRARGFSYVIVRWPGLSRREGVDPTWQSTHGYPMRILPSQWSMIACEAC